MNMNQKLERICRLFRIEGTFVGYEVIQIGNVNKTYRVDFILPGGEPKSFLLQNVNTYAFRQPVLLMENIDRVTEHIRAKATDRVCLHFHHTAQRKTYVEDGSDFWRMINFIQSTTYSQVTDPKVIYNAGRAFGEFQNQLSDFDISLLHETIPNFHNTIDRYEKLDTAVALDNAGRVEEVTEELKWLQEVRPLACRLTQMQRDGLLPLRVTHNDTKINNVLFSKDGSEPLVVIDLDTVMPGLIGHDFGDAIRFAANFVEEDCPESENAGINLEIFKAFTEGFLEMTADSITPAEADTLALSCFALTTELAVRFLDDYLRGDPYFKTLYPTHNLVRTRCQMALAKDMLKHMDEMDAIVHQYLKK